MMYKTRNDFGNLFMEVFDKGVGAEIGVQNGYNTKQIFTNWTGKILCVDIWPQLSVLKTAVQVLHGTNHEMIFHSSVEAAEKMEDDSLDWVYIDAGHSYEEVKSDFNAWFPKVRKGGIISGHDYGENDCIGVKHFIDEYMAQHPDVKMNFTTDDFFEGTEYQSWWFVKE